MIFWRIFNNRLHDVGQVDKLGFEESEGLRIPDEYLDKQNFIVMRTAHGIGDWGIISAMPRLLKQKYPNSKVFVPSKMFLQKLFNLEHNNAHNIFTNNPYVDDFIDSIDGEIFHDHYRIFDKKNTDIPLIKQMLRFWQFNDNDMKDYLPEIYWTNKEKELGNDIIRKYVGDDDFGCLLMSDRFGTQRGEYDEKSYNKDVEMMSDILRDNDLPYFYWTKKPINKTPFNFIKKALDLRNIDVRVQLFIKAKARLNISNQCGMNHLVIRYSNCYESQRQYPIEHNYLDKINYL
tara:strand:+ start:53 stop:922 length:870 start_codon:yes stop_codon:yes gene_type:complete